jgi:hypothetical protein
MSTGRHYLAEIFRVNYKLQNTANKRVSYANSPYKHGRQHKDVETHIKYYLL